MQKLKARKITDGHIGKYVEVYTKIREHELTPVAGGAGKLVNYRKRGMEVDFIIAGSFDPITVGHNDIVQIIDYLDDDGWIKG